MAGSIRTSNVRTSGEISDALGPVVYWSTAELSHSLPLLDPPDA